MHDDSAITRRDAALAWLRANPNSNPFHAALAGHTVSAADCDNARRSASGEAPTGTPWERYIDAQKDLPHAIEQRAHAEGTAHLFERRRDRNA